MAAAFRALALLFLLHQLIFAVDTFAFSEHPHSRARWIASHQSLHGERPTYLALHLKLDPEWHSYWENPGDSGAAPILEIKAPEGVVVSKSLYPLPKRIEVPPLMTFGYEDEVMYLFEARLDPDYKGKETVSLELNAEWLVCKVECIPAYGTFALTLRTDGPHTVSADEQAIQAVRKQLPGSAVDQELSVQAVAEGEKIRLDLKSPPALEYLDFFPASASHLSNVKPELLSAKAGETSIRLALERPPLQNRLQGLLVYTDGGQRSSIALDVPLSSPLAPQEDFAWAKMLAFAFLGGFLLNLMPCVFPIISIKLLSILQHAHDSRKLLRQHCLAYVLGVVSSFLAIALFLILLRQGGEAVGWGFQLQSLPFLISLSFLFMLLAFNFLGVYEINLPLGKRTAGLLGKGGAIGQFFTGMLSTVVASPCTAPFMGVAMGTAFSQPIPLILLVFTALGLGLSAPYILFMVWPGMLRFLPKPGIWMESLRQFMAFPLLATCLWLLWIVGQVAGQDALVLTLACLLVSGLGLWIKWRLQYSRLALAIIALALAANLRLLSQVATANSSSVAGDRTKLSAIPWETFSQERLKAELNQGKAVFIDFTADWCITCKVNERLTFRSAAVAEFIARHEILMLKADWTRRDPEITAILSEYQRIGVPLYLFWAPGSGRANVLPEVLTPDIFMDELGRSLKP